VTRGADFRVDRSVRRAEKGPAKRNEERVAIGGRIRIERDGDIAIWTIDRPEVRNALDVAAFEALSEAISNAGRDRRLRAIVLTGAGPNFVSGGDLRELRSRTTRADAGRLADRGRRLCDGIARLPVPVIAALSGPAIGGGAELAVACDMRVAEARAKLSFKHARMGLTTAWAVLPKLIEMVGRGAASRLLLAGHEVDAREALRIGLVEVVCEDGASLATALSWARDAVAGAPAAVAGLKRLLHAEPGPSSQRQRSRERSEFIAAWTSQDHKEAVEAFFEGRPATWRTRL
jgi:enoyl-CoA hydratase